MMSDEMTRFVNLQKMFKARMESLELSLADLRRDVAQLSKRIPKGIRTSQTGFQLGIQQI